MRALEVTELSGPDGVRVANLPEPEVSHMLTPGEGVVVDVRAAGVAFPDVLKARGLYQIRREPPFVLGAEAAGLVRSAPEGSGLTPGDRVAAFTIFGAFAEVAVAPAFLSFPLPNSLDFAGGAALILNYHTAYHALAMRGRLQPDEWVLVHGAAGGIGTAALQIAGGLGAHTIAVVSSEDKEQMARAAGADEVLRVADPWREQAQELTGGGVHLVLDPVGGDRVVDSLRCLREEGRLVTVGFTAGTIPEVKFNRLLLRNLEVIGSGWEAFVSSRPKVSRAIGEAVTELVRQGSVQPIVGARLPLEKGADAMRLIADRQAMGKIVLDVAND